MKKQEQNQQIKTGYIYKIVCAKNGSFYIGQTIKTVEERYKRHLWELQNNRHCNIKLQNCYNKYGKDSFSVVILEKVPVKDLHFKEEALIAESWGNVRMLNIHKGGNGGDMHTGRSTASKAKTSAKLSAARKGKKHPLSKITPEMSLNIQKLLAGGLPQRAVAKIFGVSREPIHQIAAGTHWTCTIPTD